MSGIKYTVPGITGLGGESGFSDADLQKLAKDIWGSTNLDIFDRFHIAPADTAATVMLDARGYLSNNGLGDKARVDVYIGTPVATIANDNAGAGRIAA